MKTPALEVVAGGASRRSFLRTAATTAAAAVPALSLASGSTCLAAPKKNPNITGNLTPNFVANLIFEIMNRHFSLWLFIPFFMLNLLDGCVAGRIDCKPSYETHTARADRR